jgi:hypothetical protein
MTLAHLSQLLPQIIPERPRTLDNLTEELRAHEALEEPDIVVPLNELRMTAGGHIEAPGTRALDLTDWSRGQLSTLLGVKWDRWFQTADGAERAEEVNRRLSRTSRSIRLRTRRHPGAKPSAPHVLSALVSPAYAPVSDVRVANILETVLAGSGNEIRVLRHEVTDRSTNYVLGIGCPHSRANSRNVGDVWGGLLVRNSGVGFASLSISMHLVRLLCTNGMAAPIPDAMLVRRTHRGIDEQKLIAVLAAQVTCLPARLREGIDLLGEADRIEVDGIPSVVEGILREEKLPLRLMPDILSAWDREPRHTAFGVSQAITLAAHDASPEMRFELERAAGAYLASVTMRATRAN